MKVLIAFDRYSEPIHGGELNVIRREHEMLTKRGVDVHLLEWPRSPANASMLRKAAVQLSSSYALNAYRRMRSSIAAIEPDVVHIHNFWPQATPAVHYACKSAGLPVVQSLHSYRILCAADVLLRDGQMCELCVESRFPWAAIRHRCVRGSGIRSAIQAASLGVHRLLGTWNRTVDVFVAPAESVRRHFIRAGVDAARIIVRPQFAPDLGVGPEERRYFLFAGRLSPEKGVPMLLDFWKTGVPAELRLAGGGALESRVREAAAHCSNVRYLGVLSPSETGEVMRHAVATIVPSLWEEPFPLVVAESYAAGTPVIAADVGTRNETVIHGKTGRVFPAGDRQGLAAAVRWIIEHPEEARALGRAARLRYETLYSEAASCEQLLEIYRHARERAASHRARKTSR